MNQMEKSHKESMELQQVDNFHIIHHQVFLTSIHIKKQAPTPLSHNIPLEYIVLTHRG